MSNQQPTNQQPNKFIAPIVIAGITIGFLASAYKFVFAKPNKQQNKDIKQEVRQELEDHPKEAQD